MDIFQKGPLVKRVFDNLKKGEAMQRKWCGFCGAHGAASTRPEDQDEAFLITFLEAAEGDGIPLHTGEIPKEIAILAPPPVANKGGDLNGKAAGGKGGFGGCAFGGGKCGGPPAGKSGGDWGGKGGGLAIKGGAPWGGKDGGKAPGDGKGCDGKGFDGKGKKGGANDIGKIFIGGLPRSANEQSVGAMMLKFGTISKVEVKYGDDGCCKGYAFVTFTEPEVVHQAVAASQSGATILDGKACICQLVGEAGKGKGSGKDAGWDSFKGKAAGGGKGPSKGWDDGKGKGKGKSKGPKRGKIFVGGLPKSAPEEAIHQHFSQYGAIDRILMKYTESGEPRGFCFIEYADEQVAHDVIAKSRAGTTIFEGKWVDCKDADAGIDKGGGKRKGEDDWGKGVKRPRMDDGWGGWGDWSSWGGWGADWGKGGKGWW